MQMKGFSEWNFYYHQKTSIYICYVMSDWWEVRVMRKSEWKQEEDAVRAVRGCCWGWFRPGDAGVALRHWWVVSVSGGQVSAGLHWLHPIISWSLTDTTYNTVWLVSGKNMRSIYFFIFKLLYISLELYTKSACLLTFVSFCFDKRNLWRQLPFLPPNW